jgi:NADH/F420H2 dehydrogenase subunit C
VGID